MPVNDYVERITKSIDKLPPIPEAARRVLELADDPDVQVKDIVEVIKYDQSITINCLKLCNSSYFGLREKVYTIDNAVVMLGLQNLIKVVLVNCEELDFYADAQKGYNLQRGELWRHSIACAIISQLLFKERGFKEDGVMFTAALLHDIGKVILGKFIADNAESLHDLTRGQGLTLVAAEKEFFGIDHAELGGRIAEKWRFPKTLINSLRNHHKSMSGRILPNIEAWVRLSNLVYYVNRMKDVSSHNEYINCNIKKDILLQFGLTAHNIINVIAALPSELKKANDILNLHGK